MPLKKKKWEEENTGQISACKEELFYFFKKFEKCNMIIFLAPLPICSPSKVTFKGAEFTMLEASAALD